MPRTIVGLDPSWFASDGRDPADSTPHGEVLPRQMQRDVAALFEIGTIEVRRSTIAMRILSGGRLPPHRGDEKTRATAPPRLHAALRFAGNTHVHGFEACAIRPVSHSVIERGPIKRRGRHHRPRAHSRRSSTLPQSRSIGRHADASRLHVASIAIVESRNARDNFTGVLRH